MAVPVLCMLGTSACSEAVFETRKTPDPASGYVLMTPYFANISSRITVQITPGTAPSGGAAKGGGTPAPPTVAIAASAVPSGPRGFLFLRTNSWFSDTADITADGNGLLSSASAASSQMITSLLTELGQTAGALWTAVARGPGGAAAPPNYGQRCQKALTAVLSGGPLFFTVQDPETKPKFTYPVQPEPVNAVRFDLDVALPPSFAPERVMFDGSDHDGVLAYFPTPATATLVCTVDPVSGPVENQPPGTRVPVSPPTPVSLYMANGWVSPKRDFLTGPQDTLTFSAGFLTEHKFSDQSAAKTVVDTVTAPVRALLPSVNVQQTTQVQTGGGKPDQTTQTTQTTIAPGKGP
jgi:hypothetical protein